MSANLETFLQYKIQRSMYDSIVIKNHYLHIYIQLTSMYGMIQFISNTHASTNNNKPKMKRKYY